MKDTGIGIPEDKLDHIFESFSQASGETTRKYGGTGLGLAITKQLVELQGGKVKVKSELGKGSTFFFVLRFKRSDQLEVAPKVQYVQEFRSLKGHRVLLVEDNAVNVLVAKKFLAKWDLEIDHAAHGQQAVEKVMAQSYDLVLMDLQMPVMDGYTATEEIRAAGKLLPIIALTASAMLEIQEKVRKVGMNDYVTKPFNPHELYAKIVRHLDLRQA
ncbi:MAG: response regulator [Cytophagales bacterium]|nr:response regulator [Cytophagales bacterium]